LLEDDDEERGERGICKRKGEGRGRKRMSEKE